MLTFQVGFSKNSLSGRSPTSKVTNPFLTQSHASLRKERNIFPFENREEECYLQDLLNNGKNLKIIPVFSVLSIGPTTGIQ